MTIKAGDLVAVVRWPCCEGDLGYIFRVASVFMGKRMGCSHCGTDQSTAGVMKARDDQGFTFPIPYLKRIPEFPELADERHDEEITA